MKKALATIFTAFILAAMLGGCTMSGPDTTENTGAGTAEAAAFDTNREITITLAQLDGGEARTALLRLIADKFEYDYPNVTIQIENFSKDVDAGKAQLRKGGIDILEVEDTTFAQYAKAGLLADLNQAYIHWQENNTLLSISKAYSSYDNEKTYFLVHSLYQQALFYRTDWMQAAGYETPPRFYDPLYTVAQEFTNSAAGTYGLVLGGKEAAAELGDTMLWSTVGKGNIANSNAGYFVQDGSAQTVFALPQAEDALERYKQLYADTMPEDMLTWTQAEAAEFFAQGKAAMLVADSRAIPIISEKLADSQWSIYRFPQGPAEIGIQSNRFAGWAVAENAPEKAAATAFLLYLSNTDNSTKWARLLDAYPIHADATIADDYFNDTQFKGFIDLMQKVSIGSYYFVERPLLYDAIMGYDAMANAQYAAFLSGKVSGLSLLREMNDYWTAAYRQEGQLWPSRPVPTPVPAAG